MARKLAVVLMLCILCSAFSIGHSETVAPAQSILLTGVGNARELGGYKTEGLSEEEMETYLPMMDQVNPAFMSAAIAWRTESCGSPLGYIMQELGVTEDEIAVLRGKFLE